MWPRLRATFNSVSIGAIMNLFAPAAVDPASVGTDSAWPVLLQPREPPGDLTEECPGRCTVDGINLATLAGLLEDVQGYEAAIPAEQIVKRYCGLSASKCCLINSVNSSSLKNDGNASTTCTKYVTIMLPRSYTRTNIDIRTNTELNICD